MAADGQVSLGSTIMKGSAKKIRRLYNDKVLAGFAGSTADAFSLFSRFESKLEQYAGNLNRSAVELAKDWRTDKMLRQLEALLVVADAQYTLMLSGTGDVIEPDEGIDDDRQRRQLCAGRGAGADGEYGDVRAGDCGEKHEDRGGDLYLYQRERDV